MKLNAREAAGFLAKPDPRRPGILIYGADAMRVALKRQDMVLALIGPEGEADMRLTRLDPADLRKDPAALLDGLKAQGFFPGQRAVLIESATDQLATAVTSALKDWQEGDAMLVLTAGALKPSSKLRKLFETHPSAVVAAIYDNPPSRAEIEAELAKAGLQNISREAMEDLTSLAQGLDPGDLRQLIEKLAVYKLNDPAPLEPAELAALAPATIDAGIDDVVQAVAETRTGDIGPLMQRLNGQGVNPTTLCITTGWHFRALYRAASHPGGAAEGVAKARPPIFGPRRDRMIRQANGWGADKLEGALQMITDTDLALRSAGQTAPQLAVIERMFIRLAMIGRR